MPEPEKFKTNYDGEPPDPATFLQITFHIDGTVRYKYTENPERWPRSGVALQRICGTMGLLTWQMNDWATRLMRFGERAEEALLDMLAKMPEGGAVN